MARRARRALLGGLLGLALWWAFLWLSPQVYYTYYRAIIPGLPLQVVIRSPPTPGDALGLLTFTGEDSLSAHGRGVLGWGMLVTGGMAGRRAARRRAQPKSS
ncbi:MAG: hypothetical protein AAF074_08025, partial [Pseudomonadota bacterium]